jgi:hypothetical protein
MTPLLAATLLLASHPGNDGALDCSDCHNTSDWHAVDFDHGRTRLPLRGRHATLPCRACHADLRRMQLDARCGSCHRDPHAGRLGATCDRCHEETSFHTGAGVAAHRRSRFPLYGRHALVPCDQCHLARGDRALGGITPACDGCHSQDFERTAGTPLDHVATGFDRACRRCHAATTWDRANLPNHGRCFPIQSGRHARITCLGCHTTLPTLVVSTCSTFTAACTRCHACNRMDGKHQEEGIAGYQCADRKCYECHPDGSEGG